MKGRAVVVERCGEAGGNAAERESAAVKINLASAWIEYSLCLWWLVLCYR